MFKTLLGAASAALLGMAMLTGPATAQSTHSGSPKSQAPAASTGAPAKNHSDAKGTSGTSTPATGMVDINSASKDELMTLPGIGEARAAAIIKNRPYRGKNELVDKKLVPQNVYTEIKDHIVARQKS